MSAAAARAVLVVEDDSVMAELERRALSRGGFAVHVAASAAEAAVRLTDGDFVACLLDYHLPDGDAWNLMTLARERTPPIPVIMVTAMGSETVAAEAVLYGVAEYIRKSDGFFERLSGSVERATRLATAHEEMRRNNSLLHTIADNAHDAIVLLDGQGTILFASTAAEPMLGEAPDALIGRRLTDFITVDDHPDWALGGGGPSSLEVTRSVHRVQLRNGQTIAVEPVFATIGEGQARRTLGMLRDVTERVRLEERVRHQERMESIGQLTGGIAHDFNNLLGVVIGNLDLLRDQPGVCGDAQEFAQDAVDAALLGADLTRRLLAFARRQDLRPTQVDVNVSVRSIARLLSRVLGADITIALRLADDVWPVLVDRGQLETALTNLAANARDAMPRGGQLVIATCNARLRPDQTDLGGDVIPGDYTSIEVSDSGSGIPQDVLGRVFEPFYTTKEPGRGTGLGLAMVFGFMRQSGGYIHADSWVGSGTIFRLFFPRAQVSSATETKPAAVVARIGDGRTVLVVEDNAKLRQLAIRQLTAAHYRVLAADGAAAAMVILNGTEVVDLLFTDIVMAGGVDGFDLARQATARRPGLRVLLTSGFPDLHGTGEVHAAPRPSHRLLAKPYRADTLLRAVSAALD